MNSIHTIKYSCTVHKNKHLIKAGFLIHDRGSVPFLNNIHIKYIFYLLLKIYCF